MHKFLFAVAGGLALLAAAGPGRAAQVEADPNKDYRITQEAGPWMIIVKSYKGPTAEQLAHELILMLRHRDNMPAYLFVFGEEEKRKQEEYLAHIHQLCPDVAHPRVKYVRVELEYGVLVGGYPDIDTARRALDDVKRLKPPDSRKLMDLMTNLEPAGDKRSVVKVAPINPFVTAFVVHNPTLPQAQVDRNKPDPDLGKLNNGRPYNLFRSGKPWTLAVKDFPGATTLQARSATSSFLSMIGMGQADAVLDAGAKQAEEVARVLRETMKLDAYVLHTRRSSVVTIGAFDGPDDPQLQQMQRQLANLQLKSGQVVVLQCFAEPVPMQVPPH
jgi:hypothetical protein